MIRTVQWTSYNRLACVGCKAADVILCIDSDLIAEFPCPLQPSIPPQTTSETNFVWHTIQATLTQVNQFPGEHKPYWQYTFSYDDEQLLNPTVPLTCSDINGVVCKGCLTTYIEDTAGGEVYVELIVPLPPAAPFYRLHSQHGCLYDMPASGPFFIDGDTGSVAQTINPGETIFFVGGAGIQALVSAVDKVTLNAQLSADAGNSIIFGTDGGLYANTQFASFFADGDTGPVQTISGGDTLNILGGNSIATVASATDIITINLELSADAGNILTLGGDGNIFLNCAAVAACVAPDIGWIAAGSAGINQTVAPGDTLLFQGANGINTIGINTDIIQIGIFTSGIFGAGQLAFPCASTNGGETYIDGNGQLRVAPPVAMACGGASATGSGINPPPVASVFNNPSPCRPMNLTGGYLGSFNYTALGGPLGGPSLFLTLSGGPEQLIARMPANITAVAGTTPLFGTYVSPDTLDGLFTAPAGGSIPVSIDFRVAPANAGDTIAEFAISVRGCAFII